MSVQLYHRDYNGFFPFTIYDKSALLLPYPAHTGGLLSVPLSDLVKVFWLAKSVEWSMDLSYTRGASPYTDVGTAVGSGTILCCNEENTGSGQTLPGARVQQSLGSDYDPHIRGLFPIGNATTPQNYALAGTATINGFEGPITQHYNRTALFSPTWFARVATIYPYGNGNNADVDAMVWLDSGLYKTCLALQVALGDPGFTDLQLCTNSLAGDGGGYGEMAATLVLSIGSSASISVPLYAHSIDHFYSNVAITGSITLNFNSFWT